MKHRAFLIVAFVITLAAASAAWAQTPEPATAGQATTPRAALPSNAPAPPAMQLPSTPKATRTPDAPGIPQLEPRRARAQLVNVKVDLTISDQVGTKAPDKKNISMVVADGERGSIRSNAEVIQKIEEVVAGQPNIKTNVRTVPLAVDAWPELDGNKIRVRLSLEYDLVSEPVSNRVSIRESLTVIVDSGVPLVVALSADPMTDRKVTLEVKASVLK